MDPRLAAQQLRGRLNPDMIRRVEEMRKRNEMGYGGSTPDEQQLVRDVYGAPAKEMAFQPKVNPDTGVNPEPNNFYGGDGSLLNESINRKYQYEPNDKDFPMNLGGSVPEQESKPVVGPMPGSKFRAPTGPKLPALGRSVQNTMQMAAPSSTPTVAAAAPTEPASLASTMIPLGYKPDLNTAPISDAIQYLRSFGPSIRGVVNNFQEMQKPIEVTVGDPAIQPSAGEKDNYAGREQYNPFVPKVPAVLREKPVSEEELKRREAAKMLLGRIM